MSHVLRTAEKEGHSLNFTNAYKCLDMTSLIARIVLKVCAGGAGLLESESNNNN